MEFCDGKVVLILGASSGIGAALAREYSRRGAIVALAARRQERIAQLAAELGGAARALAIPCDVTRDGDCERAVSRTVAAFGRVDVLVAKAGMAVAGTFEQLSIADYHRVFETNVFGVLRGLKAGLAELKKTQGRFAIIGSVSGYVSSPGTSAYSMSKFAVRALAISLRHELRGTNVSVTHIAPGFVASEIRKVDNAGIFHPEEPDPAPPWLIMPAEKAARQIVAAIQRRRKEKVITFHGKFAVFMQRHFPAIMDRLVEQRPRRRKT
jgi:short-subunit dehydrogenase